MKRSLQIPRLARLLPILLIAVLAFGISGCNKDIQTVEAKEGGRIFLDNLFYQVQLSRALNMKDVEDSYYVTGQPVPAKGETYFGVFLRVDNETSDTRILPVGIDGMKIVNATGNVFKPIVVKGEGWAYAPAPIGKRGVIPIPDTPAYIGPIRGGLILFKISQDDLNSRPLRLEIETTDGHKGEITLDV
jgi:hypothetical protein